MVRRATASLLLAALFATAAASTGVATADDTPLPPPPPPNVEEAKRHFEQGESLRAAGQYQAALEAYLKSRALVPRATNTLNAGVCLFALKRYDEAYDHFEEALTKYPEAQLPKEARDSAKRTMAEIEAKVGRLDVSANIDGTLVVDGRTRAKLPLLGPIRVLPGKHVVRVLRDGFATFEQTVTVVERETTKLDAKLEPLTSAGRLRLEGPAELEGAQVTIDGAVVGVLPWEGTLAPGGHVYSVAKGEVGTAPQLAIVIVGQTVKLAVEGKPLGPERRIVVDPPTAALSIDGVAIGKGRFQGRLPLGMHVVEAREDGYVPARVTVDVTGSESGDFPVKLVVDRNHPRWGSAGPKSRFGIEVFGGFAFAGSFGNDSTAWCRDPNPCSQTGSVSGPRVGLGGVYELPSGLGVYVQAGWYSLSRKMERQFARTFLDKANQPQPATWSLADDIRISGPFVAAGLGYRLKLGDTFDVLGRVMVSAARVTARDSITGSATGGGLTFATSTIASGVSFDGIMVDVMPELMAGAWLGSSVRFSLGVALPISVLRGPAMTLADTRLVNQSCPKTGEDQANAGTFHCARAERFTPDSMAPTGLFARVQPQLSIAYWF